MENNLKNILGSLGNLTTKPTYPIFEVNKDLKLLTQQEILDFMKNSSEKQFELAKLQSATADKQFKNNRKLTILALVFAFISIVPVISDLLFQNQSEKNIETINNLKTQLSTQNKIINELSNEIYKLKSNQKL